MSVRLCYRESMRRKDGKSKGTIKTAVGIHTYRNEKGDESYRGMSADELRHASTLIKKANSRLPGGEEKLRLKSYEKEIQEITAQM